MGTRRRQYLVIKSVAKQGTKAMARKIAYLPFPRNTTENDAGQRANAVELQTQNHADVYFLNEPFNVSDGDTLVVNGHGGNGDTGLTDNAGSDITMRNVITALRNAHADQNKTGAIIFFVCYSALDGHIAWKWKQTYPTTTVYGTDTFAQGALASFTRRGSVIRSLFDLTGGQVKVVSVAGGTT
jgi:hypothetical protein